MATLHFRSIERRRTARAAIRVELRVTQVTGPGEKIKFRTHTVSVSEHGGEMVLDGGAVVGQTLQLLNEYNARNAECRIVSVRHGKDGKVHGAFEFVSQVKNFWNMTFPLSGAKQLRRLVPARRA
jgi:hypothetical protein